ncbi:hypothetical protein [Anaerotignum sp.]|nr:hypothetical protein [Anaerotignum sp.]
MAKADVKYETREELLKPKGKNRVKVLEQGKEILPFPEIPKKYK